jgi:hypothetical protein
MKKLLLAGAIITTISSVALAANAASTLVTQYGQTLAWDGYDVETYTPVFTTSNSVETVTIAGWQYFTSASYSPKVVYTAVKKGSFGDTDYSSTTVDGSYSSSSWFPNRQLPSVPTGSNRAVRIYMQTGNYSSLKIGGNVYDGL